MRDSECISFLQWALPQMQMRWQGFRKVRKQVCKRIQRRMSTLGLRNTTAYRDYLNAHPREWDMLAGLAPITITRFYRDRAMFERLASVVLPGLARDAKRQGQPDVRVCSLGCGSGEEPYTLSLLWGCRLHRETPDMGLSILAVDIDEHLLERAERGCYRRSSLTELPDELLRAGFDPTESGLCLRDEYKTLVRFKRYDIRESIPSGPHDIVLCRYLAFTYFDCALQSQVAQSMFTSMSPGGVAVLGSHEKLPPGHTFAPDDASPFFYWKMR